MNTRIGEARTLPEVINGFQSTSGVVFAYEEAKGSLMNYHRSLQGVTDDEIIEYVGIKFGRDDPAAFLAQYPQEMVIKEGRRSMASEGIGGLAITARTLSEVEEEIPGVTDRLLREQGKIAFLGNGLSPAPLELLEMRRTQLSTSSIVFVDCFDYNAFLNDLNNLEAVLGAQGYMLPDDLVDARLNCGALLDGVNAGRLESVKHILGDGEIPLALRGADLAVNSYGPPLSTIDAQLKCLQPGGQLYTSENVLSGMSGVDVAPVLSGTGRVTAHILTLLG